MVSLGKGSLAKTLCNTHISITQRCTAQSEKVTASSNADLTAKVHARVNPDPLGNGRDTLQRASCPCDFVVAPLACSLLVCL